MRDMVMRYGVDRATSGSCTARYPHVLLGRGSVSNVSWAMTVRPRKGSRFANQQRADTWQSSWFTRLEKFLY